MSEYLHDKNEEKNKQLKKAWYEKESDDWDENDEFEACCDLFESCRGLQKDSNDKR